MKSGKAGDTPEGGPINPRFGFDRCPSRHCPRTEVVNMAMTGRGSDVSTFEGGSLDCGCRAERRQRFRFAGDTGGGACVIAKTMLFEHDTDLTVVPAWQGTAGLNYNFGGGLSVGLVYKYMGIQDPKFELTIQGTTEVFKFHNLHNHYGGLQLVYSF